MNYQCTGALAVGLLALSSSYVGIAGQLYSYKRNRARKNCK